MIIQLSLVRIKDYLLRLLALLHSLAQVIRQFTDFKLDLLENLFYLRKIGHVLLRLGLSVQGSKRRHLQTFDLLTLLLLFLTLRKLHLIEHVKSFLRLIIKCLVICVAICVLDDQSGRLPPLAWFYHCRSIPL